MRLRRVLERHRSIDDRCDDPRRQQRPDVLFEIAGGTKDLARECFNRVAHKLPLNVRMIERRPG